jgi:hypothetical protein
MTVLRRDHRTVDTVLFAIANAVNLLVTGLFLSRVAGLAGLESLLGLTTIAMALPVAVAVLLNLRARREWWTIVLPLPLIVFCAIELLFDYILRLDFRNTALLWPYLLAFYGGQIGMVGYAFSIGKRQGFITLATYFLSLGATGYAFSQGVG